ncbi:MAG: hypothetical protein ACJA0Z_003653 [Halioglobus sp.]|jgi:hypothetical protein
MSMPSSTSLLPRTLSGLLAQKVYIAENRNSLGEKRALSEAGDKSQ